MQGTLNTTPGLPLARGFLVCDEGATPVDDDELSFGDEFGDGAADGVAGDAVGVGEVGFGRQFPAGRELSGLDVGGDVVGDLPPHGGGSAVGDAVGAVTGHECTVDNP